MAGESKYRRVTNQLRACFSAVTLLHGVLRLLRMGGLIRPMRTQIASRHAVTSHRHIANRYRWGGYRLVGYAAEANPGALNECIHARRRVCVRRLSVTYGLLPYISPRASLPPPRDGI